MTEQSSSVEPAATGDKANNAIHKSEHTSDDISHLEDVFATRLSMMFLVPLVIIVFIAGYAFFISGQLNELRMLERISQTELDFQKSKNFELAIANYLELIEIYEHPNLSARAAGLLYNYKKPRQALRILEKARTFGGNQWKVYQTLTYIYAMDPKEAAKAIEAGEMAIALNSLDAQTYNNLAWIYATSTFKRDSEKAMEYAVKAVKFTGKRLAAYLDTLAQVYIERGEFDKAKDHLGKALSKASNKSEKDYLSCKMKAIKKKDKENANKCNLEEF